MEQDADLRKIQRKTHRAMRQDGLDKIAAGIFLALAAVFFIDIRFAGLLGLGAVSFSVLPEALRKSLTYPRIGYAKLLPPKTTLWHHIWRILFAIVCLTLFYVLGKISAFNWLMPFYLGLFLSGVAFASGRKGGAAIDYVLSALFFSSGAVSLVFTVRGHDPGWVTAYQLWLLSGVLIALGMIQLIRFFSKYPKPKKEVSYAR